MPNSKSVIVVVDMQNDFITGSLGTAEAVGIVPAVEKFIKDAKANDIPLIFTRDTHHEDYLNTSEGKKLPVEHCIKGTKGWEICPELLPYTKDSLVIDKPTFGSPALADAVKEYDNIKLLGLCTGICVLSNAILLKAFYPEKNISIESSLSACVTPETHKTALAAMGLCQIDII